MQVVEEAGQERGLGGGELHEFGKEELLGGGRVLADVAEVAVVEDADVRAVLVNHDQSGLEGGEDVSVAELEAVGGRRRRFGEEGRRRGRGRGRVDLREGGSAVAFEVLVELLPVAVGSEGRRGTEGVVTRIDLDGWLPDGCAIGRGVIDWDVDGSLGVEIDAGCGVELSERLADG